MPISLEPVHPSPFSLFFGLNNCTTLGFLHSSEFQKSRHGSGHVLLPGAMYYPWFALWGKTKEMSE